MNQSEENQQQQHSSSDPPATTTLISQVENDHQKKLLDLRREGSFDRCWQMVAQKITSPHFWDGAELFLARSPPEYGHPAVREALSRHMRQLLGIIIRWEDLLLVPNEYVALQAFVHGICTAGDVILSPAPFADPDLATILAEHTAVELRPVRLESRMELGLADLEKARQSVEEEEGRRVRALLLYNPHSLLGTVSPARLARILEWTNEHDLFLLVAESLAPLDLWEFSSCLGLEFGQQRLFWLWSGAKHFSLPGLEFAALLTPKPADRSHHLCADRVRSFVRAHSCAPLVQFLTAKLLDDFDWASELFAKRKSRLVELRAQMLDGLARQGLRTMRTGSTMAMWILLDMRKFLPKEDLQDSEGALRKEFADKGMLLLNSGQQLGMDPPESGGCWFRLRIGESEREVVQVLHRLQTVLAGKRPAEEELELFASDVGDGKAVVWDEDGIGADHHLAEEMIADEEEQGRNEEEEEDQEDIGSEEKEEQFVPTSSTSSAQLFLQEEFWRADNGKRMSMIREEEEAESEELLRQVFAFQQDGGLKMDGASKEETKEADEVMRQVFAIFPSQQMRWNPPEQYSKKDEKRNEEGVRNGLDAEREVEEKNNEENDEKNENGEKVEKDDKDYNEEKDENDESNMEVVKAKVEKKQRMAKSEAKLEEKKVDQKPMLMQPQVQTTLTDFSFIEELVRSSADAEQLEQRIGEERIGERTLAESSSSRQEMPLAIDGNEFYDEASTEEEEKEEEKREEEEVKLAPEEEFTPISPIPNRQQHDQPLLTISVPILVDKQTAAAADNFHHQQQANEPAAGQFGESSDSRRIIDIIDQIFHDAVQIRDFSSTSSNDSHSNQQAFTQSQQQEDVHHQQHQHQQQHWSRSDSGLAADSPVDFLSFSPMLLEHHQQQLHCIEERVELSQQPTEVVPMPMLESPEPTRNEVSLFEVFQNGDPVPLPTTSSLTRKFCREEEEEEERQLGPVAQMLDDSGIFVEMPPGSLSIDFPLRVPADQLRRRRSSEGGMMAEERTPSFEEHEAEEGQRRRLTVDLQFKTSLPAEARHAQRVWEEDNNLVLMEYDQQLVASKTTMNDNEIGWAPLESLEDADDFFSPRIFTPRIVRVESLAGFEDEDTMEDEQSRQAADALNQGSAFCPSPSPVETHRETIFGSAEEEKMPATAVPVWKPLDQLSPAEKATGLESRGEGESAAEGEKIDDGSKKMKKFSDTLDELEQEAAEEQQKRSRNNEEYTLGMEASKAEKMAPQSRRGHSEEPMEVVSAWNARMAKKMAEVVAEQSPMTKVSVEERNSMETHSEMTLPVPGMEKVHRRVGGWEEEAAARPSEVEEVREGSHRVKTVVKLTSGGHPPKKPSRTFGRRLIRHRELEDMEEGSVEMEREEMRRGKASDRPASTRVRIEAAESEEGKVAPFPADAVEEIPGRSRSYQVHHRMQMRRKEHKKQRKLRAHSRDRVVLEHTNITEVAYAGGRLGQRMEHGERLITCISTRINRFAPDEFFRHMPVGPELREKREHLKKVVHTRISRSHSVPSMSGGGQKGKDDEEEAGIGRTQIETVTITRLDGDNEEVGKEEEAAIAEKIKTGADELHCRLKQEKQQQHQHEEDKGGGDHPSSVYLLCQNAEHSAAKDHCDPERLYSIRRHISEMSENGYKKMKRLHEGRTVDDDEEDGDKGEDELHSEFKTVDYEMPESIEAETAQKRRRTSAKHSKQRRRIREQPAFVSPSRITVTTTRTTQRDGRTAGPAGIGGECDNHVTVRHTPCSNWVVSSVYRTTEYGWEKTALNKKRNGTAAAAEVRS